MVRTSRKAAVPARKQDERKSSSAEFTLQVKVLSRTTFSLAFEGDADPVTFSFTVGEVERAVKAAVDKVGSATVGVSHRDVKERLLNEWSAELPGALYLPLAEALSSVGPVKFIGLPTWVVHALPVFRDGTGGEELPATVWMPPGLFPYQQEGVRAGLARGGRILLADEMGLGKTAQALAIVAHYLEEDGPALIVTPASLPGVWRDQAKHWLRALSQLQVQVSRSATDPPRKQSHVVIVTYPTLTRAPGNYRTAPDGKPWRIVVCDEAHYLRNPTTQRSKAVMPLIEESRRAVLITGTPTPKQAAEAFSLVNALYPLQCSFQQWCNRYGPSGADGWESEAAAVLAQVMVRRLKADVLDQLPKKERQRIVLQLPTKGAKAVDHLEKQASVDDENYFKQLAPLKEQVTQDYVEYLIDASQEKFLLFAHHRSMLDGLQKLLTKRKVGFIRIDGSTIVTDRGGLVKKFQSDAACRVALLSITAAGEGLTLTAASLCVFCELCPAVPGVIEQAEARIHRIGQTRGRVDVHFLVVDGTRDEAVFARLESRSGAVAQIVDGPDRRQDEDEEPMGMGVMTVMGAESKPQLRKEASMLSTASQQRSSARKRPNPKAAGESPPAAKTSRKRAVDLSTLIDEAQATMPAAPASASGVASSIGKAAPSAEKAIAVDEAAGARHPALSARLIDSSGRHQEESMLPTPPLQRSAVRKRPNPQAAGEGLPTAKASREAATDSSANTNQAASATAGSEANESLLARGSGDIGSDKAEKKAASGGGPSAPEESRGFDLSALIDQAQALLPRVGASCCAPSTKKTSLAADEVAGKLEEPNLLISAAVTAAEEEKEAHSGCAAPAPLEENKDEAMEEEDSQDEEEEAEEEDEDGEDEEDEEEEDEEEEEVGQEEEKGTKDAAAEAPPRNLVSSLPEQRDSAGLVDEEGRTGKALHAVPALEEHPASTPLAQSGPMAVEPTEPCKEEAEKKKKLEEDRKVDKEDSLSFLLDSLIDNARSLF